MSAPTISQAIHTMMHVRVSTDDGLVGTPEQLFDASGYVGEELTRLVPVKHLA